MKVSNLILAGLLLALPAAALATEFHVATNGSDTSPGSRKLPFRTIQRAAGLAQPGDTVTVHAGVYRERVNPPRGGASDRKRIVYQAARGEQVTITGSEMINNWNNVQGHVWKVTLPNSFFGRFNPYTDLIKGDWFDARKRDHHTGAVYLNGDWLTEATSLDEVLMPGSPAWLTKADRGVLLNVAWLQAGNRIPATSMSAKSGTTNAPCSEGGECIGWIMHGDWVRYDQAYFKQGTEEVEIRAASASEGGIIELRLDGPEGELVGTVPVSNTGGWQSWVSHKAKIKPASGVKTLCLAFKSNKPATLNPQLWFAKVDATNTTIWAQFKGVNPNDGLVQINARQTVFYPDQPGRNYITVVGFTLEHAATPWAPPTAEQIGLIGTHWSKGWVIENNIIRYSTCSGVALGKHGDQYDNTSANSAEGYVKTIERGHAHPIAWTKENIGHHVVRNNMISHCEQAGIVGSLGAAFSTVTGNVIHDIHVRRLFSGAEMAGIKFHAAIDSEIRGNHIYRTCLGLWLDWMAQGTRVSGNLFHQNAGQDLFVEVDHGPFLVDNNIFLSPTALLDMSQGGAYAHNLFAGRMVTTEEPTRQTPYHPAHLTKVAGLQSIKGGDNRFYNNIFVGTGSSPGEVDVKDERHHRVSGYGLWVYDTREYPLQTGGNISYHRAKAYLQETNHMVTAEHDPKVKLLEQGGQFVLNLTLGPELKQARTEVVTTKLLGKARIPDLPYEDANGSALKVDRDFFGKKRSSTHPTPGPFQRPGEGALSIKLW